MKKKLIAFLISLTFLITILPTTIASENQTNETFENMSLCHIKVNGDGEIYVLGSHFKLGFGRCFYMKVNLQSGSIEIKNLRDSSDIIILDDNSDINIFGYFGYFNSQIRLNGLAMLATW